MEKKIMIEYCLPCGFEKQATQLSQELNAQLGNRISGVELKPTRLVGSFEVFLGDEMLYSKKKTGRLPHPGEVEQIVFVKMVN